ncbi:MAG: esterase-like activity of phytase family protein [Hormoscilla sp. GUM202]|nr:esterase-like activity of phytase family protein [Hormoscilla sp. GUM202]
MIRILEFDTETATTTGEYLYIQEDMGGGSDKTGDAVSLGNGEFLVTERDRVSVPSPRRKTSASASMTLPISKN